MTLFDGLVVVVALVAAVGGYRLGFLARALSWVGLAAGLYLVARFLPSILGLLAGTSRSSRFAATVLVLIVGAFAGQAVGMMLGSRLHHSLHFGPLRQLDRAVGAGVGVLGVVAALWLVLPTMAQAPGWPARTAAGSRVARFFDLHLPKPPGTAQALRDLVASAGWAGLQMQGISAQVGSPPELNPISAVVTASVARSMVKVEGQACNRIQDGSGFSIGQDLVVTNAHVVAGEPAGNTTVVLPDGQSRPAALVMFDPSTDIALLRVSHLDEPALPVADGTVGEAGAVFGHPGGQESLAVQPASVHEDITAVGRDLYGAKSTRRDVYVLASALLPGDSGAPVVNPSGQVIGVAFAVAPGRSPEAYALTAHELRRALSEQRASASVSSGRCLTD